MLLMTERVVDAETPHLHVSLFGAMAARRDGPDGPATIAMPLPVNRKTRALLAVILVEAPEPVTRDALCGLLWPGRAPAQARASLRQALHELTTHFRQCGSVCVLSSRDDLATPLTGLTCDVWAARAATALCPDDATGVTRRLMPELRGLNGAFEAWRAAAEARLLERARILAETALALAEGHADRTSAGERLLLLDPSHPAGWETRVDAAARVGDAARAAELRATLAAVTAAGRRSAPDVVAWSVKILPFRAIAGAPEEVTVTLTDALAGALPRLRWLSVYAAAGPRGAAEDGRQFVFLIDGTIRLAAEHPGGGARAVIRLTDAGSGEVLWAETFDIDDGPDAVADAVCARAEPAMLRRAGDIAQARLGCLPDGQPNPARDLVLSAIPSTYRLTRDQFSRSGAMLSTAIGRDPDDAVAHAWAAYWHMLEAGQGWSADPALSIRRAGHLASRAVALDPLDARALAIAGHVRAFLHRSVDEGLAFHAHALARNPALPLAWTLSGLALAYAGRHAEGLANIERARALAPCDPHAFFNGMAAMVPLLAMGRDEEVVAHAQQSATLNPALSSTHKGWLSALGHLGRRSEQAEVRAKLFAIEPNFSIQTAASRSAYVRSIDRERYVAGLRLAGLRD